MVELKGSENIMQDKPIYLNGSGCVDPTAYKAIKQMDYEYDRLQKVLKAIFAICDAADFHVEERIVLKDEKTGRIWR